MNSIPNKQSEGILIDTREFVHGRFTGIGRVTEGLTDALAESGIAKQVILTAYNEGLIPSSLKGRENIKVEEIPVCFLKSEKALSDLSKRQVSIFISPYPKLPLFGCHCQSVHTIHDVLDLTHPAYKRRFKAFFDAFRLRRALRKASLNWYVSEWSLKETVKLCGLAGKNPRIRHNGIDNRFYPKGIESGEPVLREYGLEPGYILVVGNGLPHKNLGVVLEISLRLNKQLVFVGVPEKNRKYWLGQYSQSRAIWIDYASEEDLPTLIRSAFCLAQPSTEEGYGYPPLEAMACGVPAVVSEIPVLVETTGGNALTAHPYESKIWLECFEKLNNHSLYKEQVQKGLKWVEPLRGRKAWQGHILDIEELLKKG
jgi:glycosyltransferase involved in cell wall biosynthesis